MRLGRSVSLYIPYKATQPFMQNRHGVSLIEILIAIIIVVIASIGTLTYFSSGLGNIGRQSNRRAALERARQRLEQLMAAEVTGMTPPPGPRRFVTCASTGFCGPPTQTEPNEKIDVEDIGPQPIRSTVECKDDAAAQTSTNLCDVIELTARVWFLPVTSTSTCVNTSCVELRTLRTP